MPVALKRRGDGVLGLDNLNHYYDVSLKSGRHKVLEKSGIFVIEDDINDMVLLNKIFDTNPKSYVNSNIVGFVSLLEVCNSVNPQPAIVWASSSSVYGLNLKVPFSEKDKTDQPASLHAGFLLFMDLGEGLTWPISFSRRTF
ncbi:UDP-glucuronate 5-epimerase, putative [Ricinus communis]|uniref:UDP-glucuronate 5-epimerase, putative n=1 Tax=Ricinus communis TaxID=3988 RepID=B9RQB4_RICCO|nr:UDP-glucuronate 5-epimerase, putative [Ricinus communis]